MSKKNIVALPRLYTDQSFKEESTITLDEKQVHYFKTVLRRQEGDFFRVFNGKEGEWLAKIGLLHKKNGEARLEKQLKEQPAIGAAIHLLFAPIKKNRMDILIEKSVELGVTHFHPVVTERTEVRKINEQRLLMQIIESAEQNERLDLPFLHKLQPLEKKLGAWDKTQPVLWGNERGSGTALYKIDQKNWAFLIGPVGGFTEEEVRKLEKVPFITSISLGPKIYRVETAALLCLAHAILR